MSSHILNDRTSALSLLRTRRSTKPRFLVAPGPDAAQLREMLKIASRVPDHGKLVPWRFVVIADREAFAKQLIDLAIEADPGAKSHEIEALANFAHRAPALVALLSVPDDRAPIPRFEQQLAAGSVGLGLLMAASAMGFASSWRTGRAAQVPGIAAALGHPGGTIAGYFFIGTAAEPIAERRRPNLDEITSRWPA